MTLQDIEARVREIPLVDRLRQSRERLGKACSERRGLRMSIPVQWDDDDFFIAVTLDDAVSELAKAQREAAQWESVARTWEKRYEEVMAKLVEALRKEGAQKGGGMINFTTKDTPDGLEEEVTATITYRVSTKISKDALYRDRESVVLETKRALALHIQHVISLAKLLTSAPEPTEPHGTECKQTGGLP